MAYKDNYGITKIRSQKIDNLSINWDADNYVSLSPKKLRYPVLLYTPDMNDTNEHYHIRLSRVQAKKLKDWLEAYLKDVK